MNRAINLFFGTHEVRLVRPAGIAVGYFDDLEAALRAVENEPTQYKAAYFTLNPIDLPTGIPLNPTSLRPTGNAASKSDILKRVWLLLDLDPPRPPSTNSTHDEKQVARAQTERLREHLRTQGWPEPLFCDSGNGWHLLYRIDLANDDAGTAVVRGVLARLHQLFPMVDIANFDAPRITKLYGTWARKGEHSESRPWRRSSIVEMPDTLSIVPTATLERIAAELHRADRPAIQNDPKLASLIGFLDHYEVGMRSEPRRVKSGWAVGIVCPWANEHSGESNRDTEVFSIPGIGFGFKCFHSHCAERSWRVLRAEMEARNPSLPKYFGKRKLPRLVHSEIARSFVEQNDDFVCIYDAGAVTGCWVETRWSLGDDRDYLLRRALRDYLNSLFPLYPEPEEGKYDPRKSLLQSPFLSHVLNEVRPLLPKKSIQEFDADPWLLAIPAGQVIELDTALVRAIRREDCITQRIDILPVAGPTPRFDSFLLEIACGDKELAAYIRRLCGLCLSGHAEQILVFFWGRGRNGKGVLLRLISKILGPYAVVLRPNELTYIRDDGDRMKRTIAKIIGKRLVTVNEAVGGHLNFAMLKTLSGGDRISGAKMRQDDREADATHKLILPSNDRPDLPADPAMRGRLHFVPFLGDFSGDKGDRFIEETLWREREGILYQLVQDCADVKRNGLRPPLAVTQATAELMDENDLTAQFISDCVMKSDTFTSKQNVEAAIRHWLPGMVVGADKRVDRIIADLKMKFEWGKRREGGKPLWGFTGLALERSGS